MSVSVATVTGQTFTFDVNQSDTIKHVKGMIERKEGIATDQQRLIFSGEELEDHSTLSHYKIGPGAAITLGNGNASNSFISSLVDKYSSSSSVLI